MNVRVVLSLPIHFPRIPSLQDFPIRPSRSAGRRDRACQPVSGRVSLGEFIQNFPYNSRRMTGAAKN